jgi:hypothetical protein
MIWGICRILYPLLCSNNDGLQILYNINVQKVTLMGLPPAGCAPHFLEEYGSQNGECIDYINNAVIQFNYALRYMSSESIRQYPDSMITYWDTFEESVDILSLSASTAMVRKCIIYMFWILNVLSEAFYHG